MKTIKCKFCGIEMQVDDKSKRKLCDLCTDYLAEMRARKSYLEKRAAQKKSKWSHALAMECARIGCGHGVERGFLAMPVGTMPSIENCRVEVRK